MTSHKHTSGRISTDPEHVAIYDRRGKTMVRAWTNDPAPHLYPRFLRLTLRRQAEVATEADANTRRLVACWNACLGVSTEDLEAGTVTLDDLPT